MLYNWDVGIRIDDLIKQAEEAKKWIKKPRPEDRKPMTQKKWQELLDERQSPPPYGKKP